MTNALLQIKIKQRLNKLASLDYDNLECWQIQEAFNKAQIEWVRRQMYGINSRKEGTEQSTGLIDDLRILMKSEAIAHVDQKIYAESTLPADYLYYVRVDVFANSKCCQEPRRMTVYEVEEANMGLLLTSDTKGPSFEWAETLSTLVGDKLRVYTNDEFDITSVNLVYYRRPKDVKFNGCVDPNTGASITADVICEFKDDIAEILVDEAAAILAGDIESMNQYQRETQNSQRNS
jgi:hypothetical protein